MKNFYIMSEAENTSIQTKLDRLLDLLNERTDKEVHGWIPESEAKKLLQIGTTTLWEMRNQGKITFSKINGKVYYLRKTIKDILENNRVDTYR